MNSDLLVSTQPLGYEANGSGGLHFSSFEHCVLETAGTNFAFR